MSTDKIEKTKKLGFGTMRLPLLDPGDQASIDMEQFKKMVDVFMSKGFTYFDTAYVYHKGKSEEALKEVLVKRYPRDSFVVTTKLPAGVIKEPQDMDRIMAESLRRTGLEYFDLYLLHGIQRKNYESYFVKFGCFDWLLEQKKKGLTKKIGFSYHDDAKFLDEVLSAHPEIDYVQIQLNYLDWDTEDIQSQKCYEVCRKHNKKMIIMEPIKGGALINLPKEAEEIFKSYDVGKSNAEWAIKFAASFEGVVTVLSGMSNLEQTVENADTMEKFIPLSDEEKELCFKAKDIINKEKAIACTACNYCVEGCPEGINIPKYFAFYNRKKQTVSAGTLRRLDESYSEYAAGKAAPKDCIECGHCEEVCTQHLKIIESLKLVAKEFE